MYRDLAISTGGKYLYDENADSDPEQIENFFLDVFVEAVDDEPSNSSSVSGGGGAILWMLCALSLLFLAKLCY